VRGIFAEHHAMNLERADAFLRGQHQVSDLEPKVQLDFGVLKDRAGDDREAIAVTLVAGNGLASLLIETLSAALAHPIERASLEREDFTVAAARASNFAVRPAHLNEERAALLVSPELLVELAYGLHRYYPLNPVFLATATFSGFESVAR